MRKLYVFNMMSLDGFIARTNGDLDWHNVDKEFDDFAIEQLASTGMILFGRVTYDMMAAFWPTPGAIESDPVVAEAMNSLPKIAFSKTLQRADWSNSSLAREIVAEEISALKREAGKDIAIFGSSTLVSAFSELGLIDEYRVMVNPVVLGSGIPLFNGMDRYLKLKFLQARPFRSGNLLLYYTPDVH